jgi:uncharacterized protein (TIGR02145 family)
MKTIFKISIFIFSLLICITCKKVVPKPPLATTVSASSITNTTSTLNGIVNPNNTSTTVTFEYGLNDSYGKITNPSQRTIDGGVEINVNVEVTGLISGLTYHYRLKTENSEGIAYGDDLSFTTTINDIDNNPYTAVTIGTQVWMVENLKITHYRNGDIIGTTTPATLNTSIESTPKYQWASNGDETNVQTYGRLYTWYAVNDSRKIAPVGWHIPTQTEWETLIGYLINNGFGAENSKYDIAGSLAAKSAWNTSNMVGSIGYNLTKNNNTGFTAYPGGYRLHSGEIAGFGISANWWTSSEYNTDAGVAKGMYFDQGYLTTINFVKKYGYSVRCLRD